LLPSNGEMLCWRRSRRHIRSGSVCPRNSGGADQPRGDPVFTAGEIWSHYLDKIVIWAPGNPPGIEEKVRKALASVDSDLMLYGVDSYDKVCPWGLSAGGLFGALGLVLSAVGLYGVMAMVEKRTGEIGVRMALGAFSQVAIGLAIGIPAPICDGGGSRTSLGRVLFPLLQDRPRRSLALAHSNREVTTFGEYAGFQD
jgi:hypothetical protein